MTELPPQRSPAQPYPRLQAPVYFTKVGLRFLRRKHHAADDSLGGMRVYTDEGPEPGSRLSVEIFLPDNTSVVCKVDVTSVEPLPAGGPARFDVGLSFVDLHPHDRLRLAAVLKTP